MKRLKIEHPVSQSRIFFFVPLLMFLLGGTASSFQSRTVDITASAGTRVETVPGKLLTLSFKVTNRSSAKIRFESSLTLPAGWRRLARDFPFEINAGSGDIRLVSISIPAETPAGEYTLRYGVRDVANTDENAELTFTVVVSAVKEQALKLVDSPRLVVAGDSYVAVFLLNNKGNVGGRIQLIARSSSNFAAVLDSAIVFMKPGESRSISVRVITDVTMTSRVKDVLELAASFDGGPPVRENSYVDVVPRITGAEERYIKFPLTTTLRFAGGRRDKGMQLELSGTGSLGNDEENRFLMLVRTPDIQRKSILGKRDEYQLSYTTRQYDLYLGDKSFSLSPLTEYNRYAFGASGNATLDKFTVGAFYNRTRFFSPSQKEWAGYVNYNIVDDAQVGLNYLGKQDVLSSSTMTMRANVKPLRNGMFDLEYGLGVRGGERDDAYAARWNLRESWISMDARYIHAGPKYTGYFNNLDLKNLSINVSPFRAIRFEAYFRDEKRNLGRDTLLIVAPRDQYIQLGVGLENLLTVYYRRSNQDDLLPEPFYRRKEESWQIRAGYSFAGLMFIGNADIGRLRDEIPGHENPYRRYTLFTSIQPFAGHTYGFSVEYGKERDITTLEPQERLAGSVNATIMIGEKTQFSLSVYGNRTRGEFDQTYSLFDLSLDQVLPWGHTVVLRGRQSIFTPSIEGKEIAYMAEYSIPIAVPVARSTANGQLVGRVVDVEKGEGIQNVLVYAGGATALTDRNGDYYFPSLRPDKYFVQLDMSSVGLNRVAIQKLPHEATIVGGKDSRFDIAITRSATVSGTVVLYSAVEQSAMDTTAPVLKEVGGHVNVLLELSNPEEINRRVTDSRGRFFFTGIRPGKWTLRVIDGNLPENYILDKVAVEVDIAPGQVAEASFKAIPRKRRVQIIQQGKNLETIQSKEKPIPVTQQPGQKADVAPPQKAQEPAVQKPVQVPPAKPAGDAKRADTLAQKESKIQPALPADTGQSVHEVPFVLPKPEDIAGVVVLDPGSLVFDIEYSAWPSRNSAETAAARLLKIPRLKVSVQEFSLSNGLKAYKIVAGRFSTRGRAELANARLRAILVQP